MSPAPLLSFMETVLTWVWTYPVVTCLPQKMGWTTMRLCDLELAMHLVGKKPPQQCNRLVRYDLPPPCHSVLKLRIDGSTSLKQD